MERLAYLPAVLFLALAGWGNVLFARTLSTDVALQRFWIMVAIASTLWTVCGLSVVSSQWRAGNRTRSATAAALLGLALGYDALAAYGLSRAELDTARGTVAEQQRRIDAAEAPLRDAREALSGLRGALSVDQAQARQRAARTKADKAAAEVALADAREKVRLEALLPKLEATRNALQLPQPRDARADVLPAELVAWGPVVLVTLGALLGLYSLEAPIRVAPVSLVKAPEHAAEPPISSPVANDDAPAAVPLSPEAAALVALAADPPAPLAADGAGWVRASQRALARMLGTNPTRCSRAIRDAEAAGVLEVDTTDGTAIRARRAA
jgi:hypothetical protein